MRRVLRPIDSIGRLGDDDFMVLAYGLKTAEQTLLVADRLRSAIERPVALDDCRVDIRPVLLTDVQADVAAAMAVADAEMYRDKRPRHRLHTMAMRARSLGAA